MYPVVKCCFCKLNPLTYIIFHHFNAHHQLLHPQVSSSSSSSLFWTGNMLHCVTLSYFSSSTCVRGPSLSDCCCLWIMCHAESSWPAVKMTWEALCGAIETAQPCVNTPPCTPWKSALKFYQPTYLHLYGWNHLLWGAPKLIQRFQYKQHSDKDSVQEKSSKLEHPRWIDFGKFWGQTWGSYRNFLSNVTENQISRDVSEQQGHSEDMLRGCGPPSEHLIEFSLDKIPAIFPTFFPPPTGSSAGVYMLFGS